MGLIPLPFGPLARDQRHRLLGPVALAEPTSIRETVVAGRGT